MPRWLSDLGDVSIAVKKIEEKNVGALRVDEWTTKYISITSICIEALGSE